MSFEVKSWLKFLIIPVIIKLFFSIISSLSFQNNWKCSKKIFKETARRKLDGFLTLWISCNFPLRQNHALLWSNTIMYKVNTHHLQHLTISSTAPVMIFSIPSLSLVPQVTVQILSSCANLKKNPAMFYYFSCSVQN